MIFRRAEKSPCFSASVGTVSSSALVTRQATVGTTKPDVIVWTVVAGKGTGETIWTCVMHPQIRQKTPGNCPICGMKLVPETTGGQSTAHQTPVVAGPSDGQRTQIVSGLAAGQEVITRGAENLREGQVIQVVPWSEQGPLQLPTPAGGGSMAGMDHPGQGK